MENFKDRLINEKNELQEKTLKLGKFMDGEASKEIGALQKALLKVQYDIMVSYITVLEERLNNL